MLDLNLLSPSEKTESYLLWKYNIIKNFILIILTVSFVISLVLFASKIILMKRFAEVELQSESINISHQNINNKVNAYNKKLQNIFNMQTEFIPWSKTLNTINQLLVENVIIERMELNINENSFLLSGFAYTREDLLNLQESLKKCDLLENISLPLRTLLKKDNINFTLTADINNLDCELDEE